MAPRKKPQSQPPKNTLITSFFQKGEIQADKEDIKTKNTDTFYEDCIDKCNHSCVNETCVKKKENLCQRLETVKLKFEQLKKANAAAKSVCEEKDGEIANLQCRLNMFHRQIATEDVSSVQTDYAGAQSIDLQNVSFARFNAQFSEEQLKRFRSIGNKNADDSSFVLDVTRCLYADEMEKLKSRTVVKKSKDGAKRPMTPEKLDLLRSMFTERINSIQKNQENQIESEKGKVEESAGRLKTLNQLINRAIGNLNVKK